MSSLVTTYRSTWRSTTWGVRVVRGGKCETRGKFFSELSSALQFPYYFGHNWDAVDECIQDLTWLPYPPHIMIVITEFNSLLRRSEKDFQTLMYILEQATSWWATPLPHDNPFHVAPRLATPFKLVAHVNRRGETAALRRLSNAGIVSQTISLSDYRVALPEFDDVVNEFGSLPYRLDGVERWIIVWEKPQGSVWTTEHGRVPAFESQAALVRFAEVRGLVLRDKTRELYNLDDIVQWLASPLPDTLERMECINAWSLFAIVASSVGEAEYDTRHFPGSLWQQILFGENYAHIQAPRSPYVPAWDPAQVEALHTVLSQGLETFRSHLEIIVTPY